MFSTFFLCANQTNYTVYSELCTIYIPHTIISALYFSRRKTQNFAFAAWAGALSFIAKNVADDLFFCMHDFHNKKPPKKLFLVFIISVEVLFVNKESTVYKGLHRVGI